MPTIEERFWRRVKVAGPASCWLYLGGVTSAGYGAFYRAGQKQILAHRWVYELLVGPIPEGLTIDHLCKQKRCVNPAHLQAVSLVENVMRGNALPALNARKTHCPVGHPYDLVNTYFYRGRNRKCRICGAKVQRECRRRRKDRNEQLAG